MESLFFHYLTQWRPVGYLLAFFGMWIEGDLFLLVLGALVRFHYFDPFDMLMFGYTGVIAGDTVWFLIGRRFSTSDHKIVQWLKRHIKRLRLDDTSITFKTVLLSKFMYGTHHPLLVALGASGLRLRRFLSLELPAAAVWFVAFGSFGYAAATLLREARHYVRYVELGITLIVITFLTVQYLLTRKNRFDAEAARSETV